MINYREEIRKSHTSAGRIAKFYKGNCHDLSDILYDYITKNAESLFVPNYFNCKEDFYDNLLENSHVRMQLDYFARGFHRSPLILPSLYPYTDKWMKDKPELLQTLTSIMRKHMNNKCKCQKYRK